MPYPSPYLALCWTCRNSVCKHTFCSLVLVCHMIRFHMEQQPPMFETLTTDQCQVVSLGICQIHSGIRQWQCHGVYSCQKALIQENICCPAQTKQTSFTNQGGRKTPPMDFVFSRTVFAKAVYLHNLFVRDSKV